MISIEYHLKRLLQERFENELGTIASFSLSAVDLVSYDFDVNSLDSSFDLLADRISKASNARISYLTYKGVLIGDSELTFSEILSSRSLLDRKEIKDAIKNQKGTAKRFSYLDEKETVYFAVYNKESGFIARVSMPEHSFDETVINLRLNFILIILTTIAIIALLGWSSINLIKKAVKKERDRQEARIISRTREITFLQTMTTLLNGAEKIEESAHIITNIMPKLMPGCSGAISLIDDNASGYELTHWGKDWPEEISLLPNHCWLHKSCQKNSNVTEVCDTEQNILCIRLVSSDEALGSLHFISSSYQFDEEFRENASEIAKQISDALSNLMLKERLRNQATRDPLTNLYNRRFMLESFGQSLNRAERHQGHIAVLLIDLDHFKTFNDQFGHDAGDMVLSEVAQLFKNNVRLEDIACRYGGEEFCILCPDTGVKEAFLLAEKLRERIQEMVLTYNDKTLTSITMSTGISVFPNHGASTAALISEADKALYQAKNNGRNCTVVAQAMANIKINT
jgi:diguanylate cyclase (GGDEF)-like protein